MHEVALTVAAAAVDDAIDRVIAHAPYGLLDEERGDTVVLRIRGARHELPSAATLAALAGDCLLEVHEREVPDDFRERRLLDHVPVVAGRVSVRPDWAPVVQGLVDVVIEEGDAFGTGSHPTTRACLELLCELEPHGALVDLGCGSGVLAITAARLGWEPVLAVDNDPASVDATRANASANGVAVDVRRLDLRSDPVPVATTVAANLLAPLLLQWLARMGDEPPQRVIASGILAGEADRVSAAFVGRGFSERDRRVRGDWSALSMER
jgi:ribosomal protein L11 methyltransferase